MFTGIIESTGVVHSRGSLTRRSHVEDMRLVIERPRIFTDLNIGSSVSVSGVCLSVVKLTKTSMEFDVVDETKKKTTLGSLKKGDLVNLERAMQATDRFEGHVVQGHVEVMGKVDRVQRTTDRVLLTVLCPLSSVRFVIPKGSIAIDGVSLTIASIKGSEVTIALIPHTLKNTTLGSLKKGDRVNLETDILVRSLHSLFPEKPHAY